MWVKLLAFLTAILDLVVEWIKGKPETADPDRVRKLEEALAEERREDLREVDAKAAAVRSRADADRLLRDVTDDPTVN